MRTGVRVNLLGRQGDRYVISAGDQTFEAEIHGVERDARSVAETIASRTGHTRVTHAP